MIYIALGLFFVSLIVLVVDIFIEGFGFPAVIGLLGVVASLIMTGFSSPIGGVIVLGKIAIVVPGLYLIFRALRKRQLDGRFILNEVLADDKVEALGLEYFLGKEGITKTALRPHGRADFNGTAVEVFSDAGLIPADKRIKVTDVQNKKVFVKILEN